MRITLRLLVVLSVVASFCCEQPEELTLLGTADPDSPVFEAPLPTYGVPYYVAPLKVGMDMSLNCSPEYIPYVHIERRKGISGDFSRIATLSTPILTFVDSVGLQKDSTYWYRGQSQARGGALSSFWLFGRITVR